MRHRAEIVRMTLPVRAILLIAILSTGFALPASVRRPGAFAGRQQLRLVPRHGGDLGRRTPSTCSSRRNTWPATFTGRKVSAARIATEGMRRPPSCVEAHAIEDGFRKIESPADIPNFCGHCHSNQEYMQKFQPHGSVDQVAEFWESVHGQHLKKSPTDARAASCLTCHPRHATRKADDPASSTFANNQIHVLRPLPRKAARRISGQRPRPWSAKLGAGEHRRLCQLPWRACDFRRERPAIHAAQNTGGGDLCGLPSVHRTATGGQRPWPRRRAGEERREARAGGHRAADAELHGLPCGARPGQSQVGRIPFRGSRSMRHVPRRADRSIQAEHARRPDRSGVRTRCEVRRLSWSP